LTGERRRGGGKTDVKQKREGVPKGPRNREHSDKESWKGGLRKSCAKLQRGLGKSFPTLKIVYELRGRAIVGKNPG